MGALKGSIAFGKYYVRGALPEAPHQKFLERIQARAFRVLTPEDESASVGWVPIERPFDDEVSLPSEGVFFGSYLNLALRLDRWKFPLALVQSRMAAAVRIYQQKTGKDRVSRAEKAELREAVERKLRRDGVPTTSAGDLSWNLATGELRLFARGRTVIEHAHELFEKTFGMRLLPSGPYVLGALHLDAPRLRLLQELPPIHASGLGGAP
jgi:recombination associated protein RdgC